MQKKERVPSKGKSFMQVPSLDTCTSLIRFIESTAGKIGQRIAKAIVNDDSPDAPAKMELANLLASLVRGLPSQDQAIIDANISEIVTWFYSHFKETSNLRDEIEVLKEANELLGRHQDKPLTEGRDLSGVQAHPSILEDAWSKLVAKLEKMLGDIQNFDTHLRDVEQNLVSYKTKFSLTQEKIVINQERLDQLKIGIKQEDDIDRMVALARKLEEEKKRIDGEEAELNDYQVEIDRLSTEKQECLSLIDSLPNEISSLKEDIRAVAHTMSICLSEGPVNGNRVQEDVGKLENLLQHWLDKNAASETPNERIIERLNQVGLNVLRNPRYGNEITPIILGRLKSVNIQFGNLVEAVRSNSLGSFLIQNKLRTISSTPEKIERTIHTMGLFDIQTSQFIPDTVDLFIKSGSRKVTKPKKSPTEQVPPLDDEVLKNGVIYFFTAWRQKKAETVDDPVRKQAHSIADIFVRWGLIKDKHRTLFYKEYLPRLVDQGYLDKVRSNDRPRSNLYYYILTDKARSEASVCVDKFNTDEIRDILDTYRAEKR